MTRTFHMYSLLLGVSLTLLSCGNDTMEGAKSTEVDSTNLKGTAPVQYTAGDSGISDNANTTEPMHTPNQGSDSLNSNYQSPKGHGTNTSNTTDRRTTTGSANQGDADKDIKR